jgi:hypothetical protein
MLEKFHATAGSGSVCASLGNKNANSAQASIPAPSAQKATAVLLYSLLSQPTI